MTVVKCPNCKKEAIWDTKNQFRPFCSERCKTIDFGAWASNSYAIPAEPVDPYELEELMEKHINDQEDQEGREEHE